MGGSVSNNQNQGASIEAERAAFEAWAMQAHPEAHAALRNDGEYQHGGMRDWWPCWLAARRTPATQVGAGELPHVKTWQERMVIDHPDLRDNLDGQIAWEVGNPYKDEEIDDLRDALADLRAQLAAKGQGNSNSPEFAGFKTAEFDGIKNAAPASAQPADHGDVLTAERFERMCRNELGWRPAVAVKLLFAKLKPYLRAQPDQRESAAAKLICPQCGVDRFKAPCPGMADECAMIADAHLLDASPAAQPAKVERQDDKDAARYRWLRNYFVDVSNIEVHGVKCYPRHARAFTRIGGSGSSLDEQIDATLAAKQGQDSANNSADKQKGGAA